MRKAVAHSEPLDRDQWRGGVGWEHPRAEALRPFHSSRASHVHHLPPRGLFGHDVPVGRRRSRCRPVRRARPFRDAPAARWQRADSADGRRLRPRRRHGDAGDPGARQDDDRDARPLQGRRHLRRLRRSARPAAARRQGRPRRAGRRRPRRGAGVSAAARLQGGRQPHHRDHRLPQQGPGVLGEEVRRRVRRADRLHRRRQLRHAGLRHRRAEGSAGAGQAGPRRRHRPAADDERVRRDHAAVRREDDGVAERHHGRRHRHVRFVPRHRRQGDQVRLRRRPGLRRPPGRLQGADAAAEALQGRGSGGELGLRPCVRGRQAALRRRQAQLQEVQGPAAARREDAGARCARALAQLQGSESRLLDGRRAGRGRALHHVHEADLHRGLPGRHRHPALHPSPARARPRRRARRHQRIQPVPVGLRPRLSAGVAVRGAVPGRTEQEDADGVGGDRPPRAVHRR